eukprot:2970112-Alexandrium_andersonii.AAC.1
MYPSPRLLLRGRLVRLSPDVGVMGCLTPRFAHSSQRLVGGDVRFTKWERDATIGKLHMLDAMGGERRESA